MKKLIFAFPMCLLAACSSVNIQPHTIEVSVLGWVKNPGDYTLKAPANIVEALESAGGFKDVAHSKTLWVVRVKDGKAQRIPVHLQEVGGIPKTDFRLRDADVIYAKEILW
jgi:protein involved in polysaccharide export with SLBB domain